MIRVCNIPLYHYNLRGKDDRDKDSSWTTIIGTITWFFMFIYYWIVDYGKPGFMDMDVTAIKAPEGRRLLEYYQNIGKKIDNFIPVSGIVDFIADFILYSLLSLLIASFVMVIINTLFRNVNRIYWKILKK